MFGNRGGFGGFRGGYDGPPRKIARYNWSHSFAPPPPPPALVNCGELRRMDVGKIVEISGRLHKLLQDRFVQIKDSYGITQLVIPTERNHLANRFQRMPPQSMVTVLGEVQSRPIRMFNEKWETGEIEVKIEDILAVKVHKQDYSRSKMDMCTPKRLDDDPPKITSEEYQKFHGLLPQLSERKYTVGDLRHKLSETVSLLCWVEKTSKKFITLVDGYGKIQCVVPQKDDIIVIAESLTPNAVVNVTGKVVKRPKAQINYTICNGHIELHIEMMDWPVFDMKNLAKNSLPAIKTEEQDRLGVLTLRTHTCAQLRADHAGSAVVLCGKLTSYKLQKFLTLEDNSGYLQFVISEQAPVDLKDVPLGSILKIEGVVAMRPSDKIKEELITGDIEVIINNLTVLTKANYKPSWIKSIKNRETMRLRHRYMDLCLKHMNSNLRLKSKMQQNMRNLLMEKFDFVEVDTPTLTSYIKGVSSLKVETGLEGVDYYLVQRPHLHFLFLMAGLMDRCFNICTSYLEKPFEGQLETSCLHIALSFSELDNFVNLVEQLLHHTFPKCIDAPPYKRLSYIDALYQYGSHQPDLSYDLKLHDVTEVIENENKIENFAAFCLIYRREISNFSNTMRTLIANLKMDYEDLKISANVTQDMSESVEKSVRKHIHLDLAKSFFLAYGDKDRVCKCLGAIREQLAVELSQKHLLNKTKEGVMPVWITHAPMFPNQGAQINALAAVHPDDRDKALEDITKVRSLNFSLVINGECYAEGYVANTDLEILEKQLSQLEMDEAVATIIKHAVGSGCPPYAYMSLDLNKLAAIACDAATIHEVIAFPKSETGQDMMCTDLGDRLTEEDKPIIPKREF